MHTKACDQTFHSQCSENLIRKRLEEEEDSPTCEQAKDTWRMRLVCSFISLSQIAVIYECPTIFAACVAHIHNL